jgi:hypothetical protein
MPDTMTTHLTQSRGRRKNARFSSPCVGLALLAAAALIAAGCGISAATSDSDSAAGQAQAARAELARLQVGPLGSDDGYRRERFGRAWADVDHNHCDTRNDVLARDLTGVRRRGACVVVSGVLRDRYTGATLTFRRGRAYEFLRAGHASWPIEIGPLVSGITGVGKARLTHDLARRVRDRRFLIGPIKDPKRS